MFDIILDFMTGAVLGIEHMTFPEDDEDSVVWALVLHLLILRISFVKYKSD